MIAEKQSIDLVSVVESAGVELKHIGSRHVGLCPFHSEKTPSFNIYERNGVQRCHCFGCGFNQDVIGFVMQYYNLSFKKALKFLGIKEGRITPEMRRNIERLKRRPELIAKFRKWESGYLAHMGTLINRTQKLMKGITIEDLDLYAPLLQGLPVWEYHSDILIHGSDEVKFKLYKEAQQCRNRIST